MALSIEDYNLEFNARVKSYHSAEGTDPVWTASLTGDITTVRTVITSWSHATLAQPTQGDLEGQSQVAVDAIIDAEQVAAKVAGTTSFQSLTSAQITSELGGNGEEAKIYHNSDTKQLLATGLKLSDTTASTNTTSGAFILVGGAGVGGAINAGGVVKTTDTTQSTSSTTGSIVTSGGIGVGKDIFTGGRLELADGTSGIPAVSFAGGQNSGIYKDVGGGLGMVGSGSKTMILDGNGLDADCVLSTTDATQSTSTSTGSIHTAGGLGVVKDVYVGGVLNSVTFALSGQPVLSRYHNTTQTLNTSTVTTQNFNTALETTVGFTETGSNSIFTPTADGTYLILASLMYGGNGTDATYETILSINDGVTRVMRGRTGVSRHTSYIQVVLQLTTSDDVRFKMFQSSGSSMNTSDTATKYASYIHFYRLC